MKRRERVQGPPPQWLERLWDWELAWRHRIADWLQLKVVAWPLRVIRSLFWGYVTLSALIFTLLVWGGGLSEQMPAVKQVTLPVMPAGLKARDYTQAFRHKMDSIRVNALLKQRFDSLIQARQGFADTMRQLEEYYK